MSSASANVKPLHSHVERRRINPVTGEPNYTPEEVVYLRALSTFQQTTGRRFLTEIDRLEVLRGLGWRPPMNPFGESA